MPALLLRGELDPRQRFGDGREQQAFRRGVAVHRTADEVVAAGVLDVFVDVRHQPADIDQAGLRGSRGRRQLGRLRGLYGTAQAHSSAISAKRGGVMGSLPGG